MALSPKLTISLPGGAYNGGLIGTVYPSGGDFVFNWTGLAAGTYNIQAQAWDNDSGSAVTSVISLVVNALPAINLTAPTNNANFYSNGSVPLSANTSDSDGTISRVDYYAGNTLVASATAAPFNASWSNPPKGTHNIAAIAVDNRGGATTSSYVTINVVSPNNAVFVSQTAPPPVVQPGQAYPVAITMQNTGVTTWTSAASYTLGSQNPQDNGYWSTNRAPLSGSIAPNASTTFNFNVAAPTTPGNYNFQWRMLREGDEWFGTTSSNAVIRVNASPTISISSPTNGAVVGAPADIIITAAASDTDGTVNKVEISANGNLIATLTAAPWTYTWNNVAAGTYSLTAKAYDNDGAVGTSTAVSVTSSFAAAGTTSDTNPAGVIVGSHGVSASGAFKYNIPIVTVPGTRGIEPALALTYDSQSGNGWAGMGFALSGLSVITRCNRTIAQDGIAAAFDFTPTDRFCLDGMRLIAVTGAYGANATEYRTELDGFAKIVSYGTAGTGPAYFKVWLKNGQVLEYGNTADSRIEAQSRSDVRAWLVNRAQDLKSNYMTYSYLEDNANGSYVPARIDYTGNPNATPTALSPYASVQFIFEARADHETEFTAGTRFAVTQRLANIKTFLGATLVRDYRLTYESGTGTSRSRLKSLAECAGDGTCLQPSVFDWNTVANAITGTAVSSSPVGYSITNFADQNGDGRQDGCYIRSVSSSQQATGCLISAGNGFVQSPETIGSNTTPLANSAATVDFNGDGKNDSCYVFGTNGIDGTLRCRIFNGSGWDPEIVSPVTDTGVYILYDSNGEILTDGATWFEDINGDGLTDACRITTKGSTPDRMWCTLATGTGFDVTIDMGPADHRNQYSGQWRDIRGDGSKAYCRSGFPGGADVTCHQYAPAGFAPTISIVGKANNFGMWGDINGDGKADYCLPAFSSGSTQLQCYLSTGTSFIAGPVSVPIDWGYDPPSGIQGIDKPQAMRLLVDVNNDGKADFCRKVGDLTAGFRMRCLLSTGTGFAGEFEWAAFATDISSQTSHEFVDVTGDGRPEWCYTQRFGVSGAYTWQTVCQALASGPNDLLKTVTNGFGATVNASYSAVAEGIVHSMDASATAYPAKQAPGATYVVAQLLVGNGVGGAIATDYRYKGVRVDNQGRGSLGFASVDATSQSTGITVTTNFRQDYPYTGLTASTITKTAGGQLLSEVANTWAALALGGTRYAPYLQQSREKTWDTNSSFINWRVTAVSAVDSYAQPTQQTVTTYDAAGNPDGYSQTINMVYSNNTTTWLLGLPTSTSITSKLPDNTTKTRAISMAYDAAGFQTQQIIEPNNGGLTGVTNLRIVTAYTSDAFGNRKTVTVSGSGITTRATTNSFDATGRFLTQVDAPLSMSERFTYDGRFGAGTSYKDPNLVTATWELDGFGRAVKELRPDGTQTTMAYKGCANCWERSAYYIETNSSITASGAQTAPSTREYFDSLGRNILSMRQGFDSTWIYQESEFDTKGRLFRVSRPYLAGQSNYWTTYDYSASGVEDPLHRAQSETRADGGQTRYVHNGRTKQVLASPDGATWQTTTSTMDSQGRTTNVRNADGAAELSTLTYQYDHFGNPVATTDHAGNVIKAEFDLRGRRTKLIDPSVGSWTFAYNPLSELTSYVTGKNQTVTYTYDLLSRVTKLTEPDALNNWVYDTCTNGKGKLCQITSPVGSVAGSTGGNGYARSYTYDSLGRVTNVATTLDTTYNTATSYDAAGRVATLTYPTGFAVKHNYTALGYFASLANNATNAVLWQANSRDADLQLKTEAFGYGLTGQRAYDKVGRPQVLSVLAGATARVDHTLNYDLLGNLKARSDAVNLVSESYGYDTLNRLRSSAVQGGVSKSADYNAIGNLTAKSDVGTLIYPGSGASSVRPLGVTGITGSIHGATNPSYTYDAHGNMSTGAGRSFTWMSFDAPKDISAGGKTFSWVYDADHQRTRLTRKQGTTVLSDTYYLNDGPALFYEKYVPASPAGPTEHRHYLSGPDGLVGVHLTRSDNTTETRTFHTDALGSIVAVSGASGQILERFSYDPWGKRRNVNGSDLASSAAGSGLSPSTTSRGYTGHEHLDELNLIHMNGRLYDPGLSRFISADPIIQAPQFSQSYNRYLYTWGNSLNATDPTGYLTGSNRLLTDNATRDGAAGGSNINPLTQAGGVLTLDRVEVSERRSSIKDQLNVLVGSGLRATYQAARNFERINRGVRAAAPIVLRAVVVNGTKAAVGGAAVNAVPVGGQIVYVWIVGGVTLYSIYDAGKSAWVVFNQATKPTDGAGDDQSDAPDGASGSEIDPADKKGELTKAGRAQQKHGDRAGSAFEPAKGTPEDKNQQGQQTLDGIVNSPTRVDERNHRGGTDVREAPGGRGARFDKNGKFTGFIEPRRP